MIHSDNLSCLWLFFTDKMQTVEETILCSLIYCRPVLITSLNLEVILQQLYESLQRWNISVKIGTDKVENGICLMSLNRLSNNDQISLYSKMRKIKYPIVLIGTPGIHIHKNLKKLIYFEHKMERDNEGQEIQLLELAKPNELELYDVNEIREMINNITITTQVKTYIYDLIVEVRYSRFIESGVPTYVITDLTNFSKFKTFMLGMAFVTPLTVKKCCKFVLPLHVKLTSSRYEPSLLYGSKLELIQQLISVITPEDVIEIATNNVIPPL